jgi:hypothetical protein
MFNQVIDKRSKSAETVVAVAWAHHRVFNTDAAETIRFKGVTWRYVRSPSAIDTLNSSPAIKVQVAPGDTRYYNPACKLPLWRFFYLLTLWRFRRWQSQYLSLLMQ